MWLLVLLFIPFAVFGGAIVQVATFDRIQTALEEASRNDLVVFDVDNTLLAADDMILRPCGEEIFYERFNLFGKTMSEEQLKGLGSIVLMHRTCRCVHNQMPQLVRSLQARGIKVIALTALFTGKFGIINNMEDWRGYEMAELGFDFSKAFPTHNHIVFGDIMRDRSLPVYKNGILFSVRHTKGEVLQAFLRRVKFRPERVFFIDDRRDYIDSVHESMKAEEIDCRSIHYTAEEFANDVLDKSVLEKQFDHLRAHEQWLSDLEIRLDL